MLQSQNDKRTYRNIVLPNRLQCLLVSDPDTEKSSACCDVQVIDYKVFCVKIFKMKHLQVGSLCDPQSAQGLAHFLEVLTDYKLYFFSFD
jgi:insulysin